MAKKAGRPRLKSLAEEMMTRQTSWDATMFIGMLPDPDRVLEKVGFDPEIAYQDIVTDDHLTAVWNKRMAAVTSLEWDIEQGNSSVKITDEVKAIFEDIDIRRFIKDTMKALLWGFSPIEVVWNTSGSIWFPRKLESKPTRWFQYNDNNELRWLTEDLISGTEIKPYKLLVPTNNPSYDNPYGEKLLSKVYWPITWKRNCYRWWNVFMEKFAIPYVVAKVPPNMGETEKAKVLDVLGKMLQDAIATIPNTSEVEIMSQQNKTGNADVFDKFRYSMDMATSKVILGGTLTTESGDVGSYSLGKTQKEGEHELREDDAALVEATANELINWIVELNFSGPAPKLVLRETFEASKELAERDQILSNTGVRFTKEYFINNHGLQDEDFDIVEVKEPEPGKDEEKDEDKEKEKDMSQEFKDTVSKYRDQEALDTALESITNEELQKQAEGPLKPIIAMVEGAESYVEVKKKLLDQWPRMNTEAVEDMMLQAIFVSEAWGRVNAA